MGRRSEQLYPFLVLGVVLLVAVIAVWLLAPGSRSADVSRVGTAFTYEESGFARPTDYFFPKKSFFSYVIERTVTGAYLNVTVNTTGQYNLFVYKYAYYAPNGGTWKYFNLTPVNRNQSGTWNVSWIRGAVRGRTPHLNLTNYVNGGYLIVYACQEHAKTTVLNSTAAKALPADARAQLFAAFGSKETRYFCGLRLIDEYGLDENYWMLRDFTIPACVDECTVGTKECENATVRTCSNENRACAAWTEEECPEGQWCEAGTHTCTDATCTGNATKSCDVTGNKGVCKVGVNIRSCIGGQWGAWGTCKQTVNSSTEICDGFDNDCDGATDEGCTLPDLSIAHIDAFNESGNVSGLEIGRQYGTQLYVKNLGAPGIVSFNITENITFVNATNASSAISQPYTTMVMGAAGQLKVVGDSFTPQGAGTVTLAFILNLKNETNETNKANNRLSRTFTIRACGDSACEGRPFGTAFCLATNETRKYSCIYQDGCAKLTSEPCASESVCVTSDLNVGLCQACVSFLPEQNDVECGEQEEVVCGAKTYTVEGMACVTGGICIDGVCTYCPGTTCEKYAVRCTDETTLETCTLVNGCYRWVGSSCAASKTCSSDGCIDASVCVTDGECNEECYADPDCLDPDLYLKEATFSDAGGADVTVCNIGGIITEVTAVSVAKFVAASGDTLDAGELVEEKEIPVAQLGNDACVHVTFATFLETQEILVDPEDEVTESDEENNAWPAINQNP